MAASRTPNELTSLQDARSRLEAALACDEHWRALQQPPGEGEAADASAARQARNTRLEMALADNPLYQAWKHLGEAITALRAGGADAEPPPRPSGLPEDVASLLQDETPSIASPFADKPAEPSLEPERAGRRAGHGSQPIARPEPRAVDGKSGHAVAGPARLGPLGRTVADPEEATVTFVRREPLLPSARLPADLGTDRDSALFERLRSLKEEEPASEPTFASPSDYADEAEVSIVSAEAARLQREAAKRASTIRRLRKALSGD